MNFLLVVVIFWIIILKGHGGTGHVLTEAPEHTLKKCIQDETRSIKCQDFKSDGMDMVSLWPPGPYVIPMTRFGCPESSMHGWREGYITITWQQPHSVHVRSNTSVVDFTEANIVDKTREQFFNASDIHHIHFPATSHTIKLQFCYKYRSNASVDTGSWPDGDYSIFGSDSSCPSAFDMYHSHITLPNISRWDSDGYLPDFKIFNDGVEDKLQIMLCSRRKDSNYSSLGDAANSEEINRSVVYPNTSLYRNWTHFFLVKNEKELCPTFQNTAMFEETILIKQHGNVSASTFQMLKTLCFYEQYTDKENWLFERRRKYAYSVNIVSITKGNTTFSTESDEESSSGSSFFGFTFPAAKQKTVHYWQIVDLGRTIPVSAVDITYTAKYYSADGIGICNSNTFGCFISREKWNFLYSEAMSCSYEQFCRMTGQATSIVFKRVMEGRYVTLSHKEEINFDEKVKDPKDYTVYVFTETIDYDGPDSCNTDLGMQNLNIDDDQISASSWLPEFTPQQARPYSSGWCPRFDDFQPYLKVVFPITTIIEGLTISSSREVLLLNGLKTFVSFGGTLLTLIYSDNDNGTEHMKTLRTHSSKLHAEAHTFWFLKPIRANVVKLSIEKDLSFDLACIHLELHGCRLNEKFKSANIFKRESKVTPYETVAYTSEIHTFNSILTSIGYPEHYQSSESYKWIVRFPESHFIKLIFTHLDFNRRKNMFRNGESVCNDSIILSTNLVDLSPATTTVIDHRFNMTYALSVETKETQIVLSFITCFTSSPINRGNGFRAIATYQDEPACFSISQGLQWHKGSVETCRHPSMFITPMSYLGFQFKNTTEEWTIHIPMRRISLRFLEFHIPCNNLLFRSIFKIINMAEEKSYCNINRPPNIIKSSFDRVKVLYVKQVNQIAKEVVPDIEGFRLLYTIIEEIQGRYIDYSENFTATRNVAFYKKAQRSSSLIDFAKYHAENLIDGNTFPEADSPSGSCSMMQSETLPNWWLVDLQDLYNLDYIVLYGAIKQSGTESDDSCLVSISTGLTLYALQTTGSVCGQIGRGRVIRQKGIKTRYVRLQPDCNVLSLCEVQVYGNLDSLLVETATETFFPPILGVNGEWGLWSAWTDVCFCDGIQYRHRLCDDPKPEFTGLYCHGENVSHRSCEAVTTQCEVYDENMYSTSKQDVCTEFTTVHNGLSSWSEWSSCSSDCGHGLISRTRKCIIPEHREEGKHCSGDLFEEKPCVGNRFCQICSGTFSKCYSIITKYTNWEQAQLECLKRNMTIVSMLSLSEMRFVKYLLRKRRHVDGLPIEYFNADFYVHIGLQLTGASNYKVPVWENGHYALYFTAWKSNEPSSENCTRMNFKLFDDDNTWESEDCEKQLSEYTMCEYQTQRTFGSIVRTLTMWTDAENVAVPDEIPVTEYDSNINVTVSGKDCDTDLYCRDTENLGYLNCLNVDGYYEECNVKLPPAKNSSEIYHKYLGQLNWTFSGKSCQRWDATIPHEHGIHGHLFKGEGISDAANYCRDIGDAGFLWCFTGDADTRWEPCLLNEIRTERQCTTELKYRGTKNSTITGKKCIRWDKQIQTFRDSLVSELNLANAENYCRDPLNFGFSWCYIDSSYKSEEWEPCLIEEPKSITHVSNNSVVKSLHDTFLCNNGIEIPQYLRCDGKFDCEDKFDETECSSEYSVHKMIEQDIITNDTLNFEEGSFFRCKSGEFISLIAKCDSVIDCLDASDEKDCDFNSLGFSDCTKEQFQCFDGDCIHISQVCNFVDDCIGASDEYCDLEECSLLTEYRCRNGQCIPLAQRCDGVKQCIDASDETECDDCQPNAFHCDIAVCIPMRLKCDNFEHCQDKTDETSCGTNDFTSCQDVWNAGYRKTGQYTIGGEQTYCQFDDVFKKGTMETVLHFDFFFSKFRLFFLTLITGKLYNTPSTLAERKTDFLIFDKDNGNCTQQVTETCLPTYEALAHLTNASVCYCGILNFEIKRANLENPRSIADCSDVTSLNSTQFSEKPVLTSSYILYNQVEDSRSIQLSSRRLEPFHHIKAGPAICVHDFTSDDYDFACNIYGKHIPVNERCVFDVDASGFPTGCTDGSHLINCESYGCPRNTLKCPQSYCIPHRFLCDGIEQCPGGEDENDCGCVSSQNEILIIYDAVSLDGPDIAQFARQFYTQRNIVRVLSYKASKPLQPFNIKDILLEVHDIEINRSPYIERAFDCNYKVFARNFIDSVHFTNDEKKGVIVIQNSEISKEVFRAVVQSRLVLSADVRTYRVSQYSAHFLSTETFEHNFTDIRVRRWKHLNGKGAEYFSEMCRITTKVHCPNRYKCSSSKSCIPMEQVCDGHIQCLHGDDEVLCNFKCPINCTCAGYLSNCSATNFDQNMLSTIPKNTRYLDISLNRKLGSVLENTLLNFTKLSVLNLSGCNIKTVSQYSFVRLRNLRSLDLSFNSISILSNFVFASLVHLRSLNLRGNSELSVIEKHAFDGLSLIQDLDLANAKILKVSADTFVGLKLKTIDLSNNKLHEIESYAFRDSFVESINFDGNDIKQFNKEIFTGLIGLKTLKTPEFKFCCIRPNYVPEDDCYPLKDEFSSCDDLMRHSVLQFMIWLIGIMALLGNALSIFYRITYDRERLKLGFGIFVANLAMADFLMAVYLMIIAIADSAFRKRYIYVDDYWRHSIWCNIAGVLSTTSSEASVLFLCLITLDRLLVIKFPFGGAKITTTKAKACAVCIWLFSFFVALLPIAHKGYFKNEFYSKSGVCIALPLTRDRPPGWAYSLALFICLNFITFILVAIGQLSIFVEIRKSAGVATSAASSRKRDLKVARNLLLVVATDFMCWFPIGVMGMLALADHPVSGEVYAWAAVFILPVNSALNPLLYTVTAIIGAKSFNPSTDEQSFKKITKDIGETAMKCIMAGHHIFPKRTVSTYTNISTISTTDVDITSEAIIKIVAKLALSLDALHRSSLGINPLDEKFVYVGVQNKKLTGIVKIKGEPFISYKPEDKQNNIYQLGILLRSLIAAKQKKSN